MSGNRSTVTPKILLVVCGTLFALLATELILRAFSVDLHLLRKTLYYQCTMPQLHRTSPDVQRLFELVPNSSLRRVYGEPHFKDTKYANKMFDVNINALGFRGKNFSPAKKAGVFRIMIFGGSNTFGMNVNDEDTYPAQMQKIFDEKYPGKVEVWNAGMCAYVMSQDVAYAESVIKKFDPDLVILQDTNQGRRAFFGNVTDKELREFFSKNSELFTENMPFWGRPDVLGKEKIHFFSISKASKIHYSLARASALYRAIYASLYGRRNDPADPIQGQYNVLGNQNAQMISGRELRLFTERHKDKKILWFFITDRAHDIVHNSPKMGDNVVDLVLNTKDKPSEYQETHPPSYVYAWYARELCDFLAQKGYIPADNMNRKEPV
jgi:hypothetical protein